MVTTLLLCTIFLTFVPQSESLSERHRRWLDEEVVYIITDQERERFLALRTDAERERFIVNFWDLRDPIRETLANEYRDEHYERLRKINRLFRESARDAWRTDRGRIYITLGPPNDVQQFPNPQDLYPLEIWSYYSLDIPDLPSALNLMFFKRRGIGEYRLYSPAFDGLPALVAGHQLLGQLGNNPYRVLPPNLVQMIEPDILSAAVSVALGFNRHASEMVLADLNRPGLVHEKMVKKLGTRVASEVIFTSQMNAALAYHAFQGEYGFTEVHLAVELPPEDLTFTKYEDKYRGRVDIFAALRDQAGNTVEEFQDVAEFSFSEEAFQNVQHYPFLYQRKMHLLPGRYDMDLLLRNPVIRRLGIVRQAIQVAPFLPDQLTTSSLLLAYKVDEASSDENLPYRFGAAQFYPKVDRTFGSGQPIYAFINMRVPNDTQDVSTQIRAHYRLRGEKGVVRENTHQYRGSVFMGNDIPILLPIPTEGLEPGSYVLELDLHDQKDHLIDDSQSEFALRAESKELGRLVAEGKPSSERAEMHFNLGMKYYHAGEFEPAARRLRAAIDFDPSLLVAKLYLGSSRAFLGDCDRAVELLQQVIEKEPIHAEAHAGLGYCFFRMERFTESAASYREALKYDPEQPELLNALGQSELRAGNHEAAIEAFSRSLEISPEQREVQAILQQLEKDPTKMHP